MVHLSLFQTQCHSGCGQSPECCIGMSALKHNEDQEMRSDGYWLGHLCGQFVKMEVYEKAPFSLHWLLSLLGILLKCRL